MSPEDLVGAMHGRFSVEGADPKGPSIRAPVRVGQGPSSRHLPLCFPADEGLWDILIKDIPKEVTSYTFSMDILKPGVSYDFRVIAVNDYGFGTPSSPSQSVPGTVACG